MEDVDFGNMLKIWSTNSDALLTLGLWNGQQQIGVKLNKAAKGRPEMSKTLEPDYALLLVKEIDLIMTAGPTTKRSISREYWDKDESKMKLHHIITFVKDDANLYSIEIQFDNNGQTATEKFELKGVSGVTRGTEKMTDAERSSLKLEVIRQHFAAIAPAVSPLSRQKWKPKNQNNNSGGGGGMPANAGAFG